MTQPDPPTEVPRHVLATPLVDYLIRHARSPGPAFTHLGYPGGGEAVEDTIDRPELLRRVRAVAARIREVGEPGQLVAIVASQDLGYVVGFLAVLYAGYVAVPLFAPGGFSRLSRLVGVLADCSPPVWLTSEKLLGQVHALAEEAGVPAPDAVIAVDGVAAPPCADGPVEVDMDAPAYLQYTSGSTGMPAGAVITHRALVASCWQAQQMYGFDDSASFVGWIPFFHDMGLIQLICAPVFCGARSVFLAPLEFAREPLRWLRLLADYPDAVTAAPNFAFDLAAGAAGRKRLTIDLSRVKVALNGSEPVRSATVAAFEAAFGPLGLPRSAQRPCYGLAEATVFVASAGSEGPTVTAFDGVALQDGRAVPAGRHAPGAELLVSVGRTCGQLVLIVDKSTNEINPRGELGEIWVWGSNVARGYWGHPERGAGTFDGHLADAPDGLPADGWLRTGDLGVLYDGLLYVTGRLKDLIIVDGRNYYPQDIEETVAAAHSAIRRGRVAAFAVPGSTGEEVVVVAECRPGAIRGTPGQESVAQAVRRAVSARHELALRDVQLVRPGAVPRTSSGKVSRASARDRWRDAARERE